MGKIFLIKIFEGILEETETINEMTCYSSGGDRSHLDSSMVEALAEVENDRSQLSGVIVTR